MTVFLAYILKPFILVAVLVLVWPAQWAVRKWMRPSKLKDLLLSRI